MSLLHAAVLGIVQGIAEFLPISSSGHLTIIEAIFGISAKGGDLLLFNVLLHCGSLVVILFEYRKEIIGMLRHPLTSELKWLILATVPTVIGALLIDFDEAFESEFIVWSFLITSAILTLSVLIGQWREQRKLTHTDVRWYDALVMGLMQVLAILPGVSRFGSTASGGIYSGLTRKKALDFSFLMCIPAICGSILLEGKDLLTGEAELSSVASPAATALGMALAMLTGFAAVRFIKWFIKRHTLAVFAFYTFLLSAFLVLNRYALELFAL